MNQMYSLLAIVFLGLGLELIYAYKIKTDKKRIEKFNQQYQEELDQTKKQLQKILESTKKESQKLISKSLDQYEQIQKEVEQMSVQIAKTVQTTTGEIVKWQKNHLDDQIRLYQHEVAEHTKKSLDVIDEAAKGEIVRLSNSLHTSISKTHREIIKTLINSAQDAEKEIDAYKKAQKNS